jgi:cell volume regulation protein A
MYMAITPGNILLISSILLLLSIFAGKTSARLGVPTLLFFLVVGIMAGSEGIGGIYFDNPAIAQFIGITALIFILFSGGLDTDWKTIRPVLWKGIMLSTFGVFITAITVGYFVHYLLGFSLLEGILLGSIVSATDAAAVFSILKSKGLKLKNNTAPLLELESGSNDPMAYFLTISLTGLLASKSSDYAALLPHFLQEFFLGAILGIAMGKISTWLINNIQLKAQGVYPVLLMALAVFTYAATDFLGGNGFLAVYLCALILGNSNFIHKKSLTEFFDGQAWLMQIVLFLTLGLLVFPQRIYPIAGTGLLIAAFLIFIARPLSVFISLSFFKMNIRSKLLVSWVGLRGAVPIVFATYPLIAGLDKSGMIFNLVFFISVSSVLLQGTTLAWVARLLKQTIPEDKVPVASMETAITLAEQSSIHQFEINGQSKMLNKKVVQLNFPAEARIIAIKRGNTFITADGFTRLLDADQVYVVADNADALKQVTFILGKAT